MVLLTTPLEVELLVCNGEGSSGQPISERVCRIGIIYLARYKKIS